MTTTNGTTSTTDSKIEPRDWPTIPEAAAEYGLPERYIKRLVDERRITVYKLDRVRIVRISLEDYIERTRREAVSK
jgi:16S rRNA U516 pseudouridylate synthase RsuA-like enzyme